MRIVRFQSPDGTISWGEQLPDGSVQRLDGHLFEKLERTGAPVTQFKLLAPLQPTAILCIGLNYRHHATETNAPIPSIPVLFMKSPGAVQNPGDPILLPRWLRSNKVDYECELAVVIGKACKNVRREHALEYVLGYTAANDVSARDWQKEGGGSQWCRGKSFDTFAPLGPCIVTTDELPNPQSLRIQTAVNGETLQDWSTSDMIFDVATLIEFLSGSTTLLPDTVILTGTPHGVGMARQPQRFLKAGDSVTVEIEQIGRLTNPVQEEDAVPTAGFTLA